MHTTPMPGQTALQKIFSSLDLTGLRVALTRGAALDFVLAEEIPLVLTGASPDDTQYDAELVEGMGGKIVVPVQENPWASLWCALQRRSAYASATPCPVLTWRTVVRCYAIPGTDSAGMVRRRAWYKAGVWRYAMCTMRGTDEAYCGTKPQVAAGEVGARLRGPEPVALRREGPRIVARRAAYRGCSLRMVACSGSSARVSWLFGVQGRA
eukprot:2000710-Rhodomonas_salina.2